MAQTQAQPAGAGTAPGTSGQGLSEKEEKARALQERLDKRGALVATSMRKFITAFFAGRQKMLDDARAAELAKKGKKKGKKKKKGEEKKEKGGKDNKKKGKVKTPVQEAWFAFLSDLDERINKAKRCSLEDMYRGVLALAPPERRSLACIIASTSKKMLPDPMNINQMNIKEAVYAASAAFDAPVDRATTSSTAGLKAMQDRGGSVQQLLEHGFAPEALVRNNFVRGEVIAGAAHRPDHLREAGIQVHELVECCAPAAVDGWRGTSALRSAGFTATELTQGGMGHVWNLQRAGYHVYDMVDAGISPEELAMGGLSLLPGAPMPLEPMTTTMQPLCQFDTRLLPKWMGGVEGSPVWSSLMAKPPLDPRASKAQPQGAGGANRTGGFGATGGGARPPSATMAQQQQQQQHLDASQRIGSTAASVVSGATAGGGGSHADD